MRVKHFLTVVAVAVLSWGAVSAVAAPDAKYGYVDIEQLFNTPAAQEVLSKQEIYQSETRAELTRLQQDLERQYQELSDLRGTNPMELTAEQRGRLEKFQNDQAQFEDKVNSAQELPPELTQELEKFQQNITSVIGQVAKEKGVTMVVNKSAILWSESFHDLTEDVMEKMQ